MDDRPESRWTRYRAIIFDLDGTLLQLAVDWGAVEDDLIECLRAEGVDPAGQRSWELLDAGKAAGIGETVDRVIAEHEKRGAENATRLPLADVAKRLDRPTGVVSLNAESAVRTALEVADLIEAVDVVIGRDTVAHRKPHPGPLEEALRRLEVPADETLFVGDSDSDRTAARRAGIDFEFA